MFINYIISFIFFSVNKIVFTEQHNKPLKIAFLIHFRFFYSPMYNSQPPSPRQNYPNIEAKPRFHYNHVPLFDYGCLTPLPIVSLQNIEKPDNGTKINSQENKISTDLSYGLGHILVEIFVVIYILLFFYFAFFPFNFFSSCNNRFTRISFTNVVQAL